jgi:hypothetical protein
MRFRDHPLNAGDELREGDGRYEIERERSPGPLDLEPRVDDFVAIAAAVTLAPVPVACSITSAGFAGALRPDSGLRRLGAERQIAPADDALVELHPPPREDDPVVAARVLHVVDRRLCYS